MLRLRLIEEAIADRYSEQEIRCPVHLCIGQEASAVGACSVLSESDIIVSTHRSHGHYLAKGGDLDAMLGELYGRVTGCCGGRGGSMHLFDQNAGILASVPIVGSTIPIGVGAALTFQQRQEPNVSMIFLGDGATEEGVFHESMNFASVHSLPAVFVIENNLFSVYTSLENRQPERPMTDYGKAHSVRAAIVDGNDVVAVHELSRHYVEKARNGEGPGLIIANTYRWREHCGPNFDNDLGYRSREDFESWEKRCPIEKFRRDLTVENVLNEQFELEIEIEIREEITDAFDLVRQAPFPDPTTLSRSVYA